MSDALSPYSAVLLASYGGPRQPEDVLPFMRNATAGRGVPDERLLGDCLLYTSDAADD